jgi:hypothetical protein
VVDTMRIQVLGPEASLIWTHEITSYTVFADPD